MDCIKGSSNCSTLDCSINSLGLRTDFSFCPVRPHSLDPALRSSEQHCMRYWEIRLQPQHRAQTQWPSTANCGQQWGVGTPSPSSCLQTDFVFILLHRVSVSARCTPYIRERCHKTKVQYPWVVNKKQSLHWPRSVPSNPVTGINKRGLPVCLQPGKSHFNTLTLWQLRPLYIAAELKSLLNAVAGFL